MTAGRGARTAVVALVGFAALPIAAPRGQRLGASRTILLTVSDERDWPVIDLLPDDFIVQEGGDAREVLNARLADYPVVLMVDNGTGTPGDFEPLRHAAGHFIERLGPRPIALGRISNPPALITGFSDGPDAVAEALGGLEMLPTRSSPAQGVIQAAELLSEAEYPFSTIVIVSSETAETAQTSTAHLVQSLADSRARLYVVSRRQGLRDRTNLDYLANLSEQTGDSDIPIFSAASFEPAMDRVADRLLTEMMVEFLEPPGAEPSEDVRVGVRRPGARAKGLGVTPP